MIFGKHVNKYYVKYLYMFILGMLSLILVDFFQLRVPELYKYVVNGINDGFVEIDGIKNTFDMDFLLDEVCAPLFLVVVCMVIGRFAWRICFFGSATRIETEIRGEMFDHCKDLSQQYYQVNKVGNLMSLFTNDLETIHECFGSGVMTFCDALFLGTMAIIKMTRMNIILTVLCLIPMAFLLIVATIVGKYMTKKWDIRQQAFSDISDFTQESISGISVIKSFVKETKELMAFSILNKKNEDANVEYARWSVLLNIFVTLFVESVICVILGYGGYLAHEGIFNGGQLIEFIGYFTAIVWPVMAVSELIEMHSRGVASMNRVGELLDSEIDVKDSDSVQEINTIKGDIEFRNLSFTYPGANLEVLHDVSFSIRAGENVGIIGKTGAGKTTVVDLILRTYNVPDGTVFIDGTDVNRIPIKTVRANAAYVPQDNFLFSDTIANNISFASDTDDRNLVESNARLSNVYSDVIDFENGFDTILGERGVTVSGGQKQRISIARALMKNAPILILDDSVSAVDTNTEKLILDNLSSTRKGKTTILIAHRITTIERMDKIIFIDDGKIVDVGSHQELYSRSSEYRKMVDLQRLDDERKEDQNA